MSAAFRLIPTAVSILLILSTVLVARILWFPSTQQQTIAYQCGALAQLAYDRPSINMSESDWCKKIRLRAIADGAASASIFYPTSNPIEN